MTSPATFDAADPAVREAAMHLLDQVSAPMTARQIEHALREYGVSKSQRSILASAIHRLNIIAIIPEGDEQ
jgi:hypothetical protein